MDKNNIKISVCILTKNDDKFIKQCIEHVAPYIDEIVILDANDDDITTKIIENIKSSSSKPIIYKKTSVSYDFSKDRNELQSMASGDYILHVDCDERFDTKFLSDMKYIINSYLNVNVLPILFRFPRINQPDRINYPDYQIRLLNKKYTKWKKKVHETPGIISLPKSPIQEIGMNITNMVTLDYPITHLYKDKTQLQIRWKDLVKNDHLYKHKKLLILSIFKNSELWINDILECMNNFYQYNENICEDTSKLCINFSFVDGKSNDDTFKILENYCKQKNILDVQLRQFEPPDNIDPDDSYIRFKKLAIVRNHIIEESVKQFPLDDDDYILFVDSDIKFGEKIIYQLIDDMKNYNADIIAPLIYVEDFREFGNSYFYDILAFRDIYGLRFDHIMQLNDIDINRPNEVGSIGSFYIMKYKVAKNVKYTGEHDSEQAEFCENARSKGFKIFIDPRLSVLHINLDKYGLEWH